MNANRNNTILVVALTIVALLCSLPMEWMTLTNPQVTMSGSAFPSELSASETSGLTMRVNGTNGYLTLGGLKVPFWLLVAACLVSAALTILRACGWAKVPKWAVATPAFLATIFVFVGLMVTARSDNASAGMGMFVAVASTVIIAVLAFRQERGKSQQDTVLKSDSPGAPV